MGDGYKGSTESTLVAYGCDLYQNAPDNTWDFVMADEVRGTRGYIHNFNHASERACLDVVGNPATHAGQTIPQNS